MNAWLVEHGYAHVMTVPPNVKYQDLFLKLQREAKEAGRRLWGRRRVEEERQKKGNQNSAKEHI